MRATRETQLPEVFPSHEVGAWLGNSQRVAQRCYVQVMEDHFTRAQNPAVQPVHRPVHGETPNPRGVQAVSLGEPQNAAECNSLPYSTLIQVAEAGLEPARG